jgi:hypothetical protein
MSRTGEPLICSHIVSYAHAPHCRRSGRPSIAQSSRDYGAVGVGETCSVDRDVSARADRERFGGSTVTHVSNGPAEVPTFFMHSSSDGRWALHLKRILHKT